MAEEPRNGPTKRIAATVAVATVVAGGVSLLNLSSTSIAAIAEQSTSTPLNTAVISVLQEASAETPSVARFQNRKP